MNSTHRGIGCQASFELGRLVEECRPQGESTKTKNDYIALSERLNLLRRRTAETILNAVNLRCHPNRHQSPAKGIRRKHRFFHLSSLLRCLVSDRWQTLGR